MQGASTPTASVSLSMPESPRLASSLPLSAPPSARRPTSGTSALTQPPPAVPPVESSNGSVATGRGALTPSQTPTATSKTAGVYAALHDYSPVPLEADERSLLQRQIEQLQNEVRTAPTPSLFRALV